jgi:Protein of unknown function DUF262
VPPSIADVRLECRAPAAPTIPHEPRESLPNGRLYTPEQEMKVHPTPMTVADYCLGMSRSEIIVNRDYQRSDKVWPPAAKSYLIETMLLGYPVPKLYLYQVLDLRSRKTYKEIVDGQQRSVTILQFYNDEFRLSDSLETDEIAGKIYSELEPEFQSKFLEYSLAIDTFVAATQPEVVDSFRRMNSYTIPLNPEEQRHAVYQGRFKWFVATLAKRQEAVFLNIGLFSQKQLVRMADAKLLTEVCDALLNGIRTTNKSILDGLYRSKDDEFPEQSDLDLWITEAVDTIRRWGSIHKTSLMKSYIVYSLLLAIIHTIRVIPALQSSRPLNQPTKIDVALAEVNLTALSNALDYDEPPSDFSEFAKACSEKTNVKEQRQIRFRWLCRAISEQNLH